MLPWEHNYRLRYILFFFSTSDRKVIAQSYCGGIFLTSRMLSAYSWKIAIDKLFQFLLFFSNALQKEGIFKFWWRCTGSRDGKVISWQRRTLHLLLGVWCNSSSILPLHLSDLIFFSACLWGILPDPNYYFCFFRQCLLSWRPSNRAPSSFPRLNNDLVVNGKSSGIHRQRFSRNASPVRDSGRSRALGFWQTVWFCVGGKMDGKRTPHFLAASKRIFMTMFDGSGGVPLPSLFETEPLKSIYVYYSRAHVARAAKHWFKQAFHFSFFCLLVERIPVCQMTVMSSIWMEPHFKRPRLMVKVSSDFWDHIKVDGKRLHLVAGKFFMGC